MYQQQQQTTTQDTGALANIGTDTQQQAPTMLYGSDYSLENYVGGQPEILKYILPSPFAP